MGYPLGAVRRDIADRDPLLAGGLQIQIVVSGAGLADQLHGIRKLADQIPAYGHFLGDHHSRPLDPGEELVLVCVLINGHILREDRKIEISVKIHFGGI